MGNPSIAIVLTARSSWAKLEPVCCAMVYRGLSPQIIACGSALLERYGRVVDVVRDQGYTVAAECWTVHEGSTLVTSAKETGALVMDITSVLWTMRPQLVVVCADRHEVLAAATAASYLHLPLLHLQGGERSGSIDDKVRGAVTALADYHCVCTARARYRVYGLGGIWGQIWHTGCPSIDVAAEAIADTPVTPEELGGAGPRLDTTRPFVLCLQHPVSTEVDTAAAQMATTLEAIAMVSLPRLVFWPAEEAGADAMSKTIRGHIVAHASQTYHTKISLPPRRWLRLVRQAACLVGNSSTGIRECSFLGTPVVNIGTRQDGRERATNVVDVPYEADQIQQAVMAQIAHGRYPSSTLYGGGTAGHDTAAVIEQILDDGP